MSTVALYACDTMVEVAFGHLVGALTLFPDAHLVVVAETSAEVSTCGGLHLRPTHTLDQLNHANIDMLVLPGGSTWDSGHEAVLDLAAERLAAERPVAAIGGATRGLARRRLLDARIHTSNSPEFLAAGGYGGARHYEAARVVVDGALITAPDSSPLEFTREILLVADLLSPSAAEAWYQGYVTGQPEWFARLEVLLEG
ncbi:DJ-1/PfpI family protein [Corynebacterium sp.]|uniref:DJ-1/PfpI family protein n=1 Tax=Corynebacterium sp. TaxID=1720 RepID=UPI0026DF131B|nr:DJ-1/PfpI family protein [Corynebacterium sp.]MDO5511409.1 DJ-1/PfpI family protein [Corynebacterium sp.]